MEDIGLSLIDLLGAIFDLSPELFEEHLYRSDYRGYRASETSPLTWTTGNLLKLSKYGGLEAEIINLLSTKYLKINTL